MDRRFDRQRSRLALEYGRDNNSIKLTYVYTLINHISWFNVSNINIGI